MLWLGNSISQFGVRVGQIALPLLAVTVFNVQPFELGLLNASNTVGLLLIGLPAGAWIDRMRHRRLMVSMDLVRAVLLATIAIAGWAGVLNMSYLVVVTLLTGIATVFFDVAHLSYLPSLVGREHLLDGNAKLHASHSVAVVSGPALGGGLVTLIGAANTTLMTSFGFLVSAVQLIRIRTIEPKPIRPDKSDLRAEIIEGLHLVFGHPVLRAIACCTATANIFMAVTMTLNVLFLTRDIGLTASTTGLLLACAGVGGVIGALTGTRFVRRFGQARAVWMSLLCTQPFNLLLPLAEPDWRVSLFAVGWLISGYGSTAYNIAQVTVRQRICPDRLLGRMNASNRVVVWGTLPLGSLLGGVLAETVGARTGLWLAGTGLALSVLWLLCSPLRSQQELPLPQVAPL